MINIYAGVEDLSRAAAELFKNTAEQAVQKNGRFTVALSGGHTPHRMFELLASKPYRDDLPWGNMFFFWGDERCVPLTDPENNAGNTLNDLLKHVPVPSSQVHRIISTLPPAAAADQYEAVLRLVFRGKPPRFDLIFLGLGADGHTASLFPGTDVLNEKKRWVSEVSVPGKSMERITLTIPSINHAKKIAFLVSGKDKAAALAAVLENSQGEPPLPAGLIKPDDGEILWLADNEAASLLKKGKD